MTRSEFNALEETHHQAFKNYLRCECRNRLTRRGCTHLQECERTRQVWYAAFAEMGLVAPDQR